MVVTGSIKRWLSENREGYCFFKYSEFYMTLQIYVTCVFLESTLEGSLRWWYTKLQCKE